MANGFRFKKRLPAYIGRISDIDDTLIAEDKEFDRLESLLYDFTSSFTIDSIRYVSNPDFYLTKYEKDFGLSHSGTIDERIARIKVRMLGKRTTTEKVVLEIASIFNARGEFNQRYSEYAFTLDLYISNTINLIKLEQALRDVIPAHLDFDVRVFLIDGILYKEKTKTYLNPFYITGTNRHKTGQVFKPMYAAKKVTERINLKNRSSNRSSRYTKAGERKGGKR